MAKRENEAKIKRLRRCAQTLEVELKELFFLSQEQAAPIKATIEFVNLRCDALEANDAEAEREASKS